jgi:hypothetical protein
MERKADPIIPCTKTNITETKAEKIEVIVQ